MHAGGRRALVLDAHTPVPPGILPVTSQVRVVEAAKDKLKKELRSASNKNLAGMVTVQA